MKRQMNLPPSKRKKGSPSLAIPSLDQQARISAAVHYAVCEATSSDGFGKCLWYALAAQPLVASVMGTVPYLQGGSLLICADPPDGNLLIDARDGGFSRGEYHAWLAIASTTPKNGTATVGQLIDFSSRHFKRFVDVQEPDPADVKWRREDPPEWIWDSTGTRQGQWNFMGLADLTEYISCVIARSPVDKPLIRCMWDLAFDHYRRHA